MRQLIDKLGWEMGVILVASCLYVAGQYYRETAHVQGLVQLAAREGLSSAQIASALAGYHSGLHVLVPLLAGTALLLLAWSSWRWLALPKLASRPAGGDGWFYLLLTLLLLGGGLWVYHFLRLYVRLIHDSQGTLLELRTYSLYRKQTVFAEAVAAGLGLGLYEGLVGLSRYLRHKLAAEADWRARYVPYGLVAGVVGLLLLGAGTGPLTSPLWNPQTAPWLLLGGVLLLVFGLQHLAFHYFVGVHPAVWSARWLGRWLWWTSLSLLGSTALWLAYRPGFPLARRPVAALAGGALAAAAVVVALRRTLAREQQTLETQASHSAAELAGLRAQINPHFLFNALNSLYATALQGDSDKTAQGIQQLGEMMRFMLEENNQDRIPLHKEVAYLRSYIDLQRLRLDETQDIDIRINLQTPERDIYLAPMLLSPLVENAFNHGISLQAPSWIHITLTLDTTQLYFKVHNSRHPRPGPEANKSPGVGLTNVRQRLELLYPQRHELTVQSSEQDYFVALTLRYW